MNQTGLLTEVRHQAKNGFAVSDQDCTPQSDCLYKGTLERVQLEHTAYGKKYDSFSEECKMGERVSPETSRKASHLTSNQKDSQQH